MASWPITPCMPIPELNRAQGTLASKTNAARGLTQYKVALIRPEPAHPDRQRLPAKTIPKPLYP
jgi:hypothetical protein